MEIKSKIYIKSGRHGRSEIVRGESPEPLPEKPRPTRKAELMAFAIVFDDWLAKGEAEDYSHISRITGISRFRVSKIMNLMQLTPSEQSELLFSEI